MSGRLSAGVVALTIVLTSPAATSEEVTYYFDIPAQDMRVALQDFGKTARRPVSFDGDIARGRQSEAIKGGYSPDEALQLMLDRSGLTFRQGDAGVIFVVASGSSGIESQSRSQTVRSDTVFAPGSGAAGESGAAGDGNDDAEDGEAEDGEDEIEVITVTATRVDRDGYSAPTPLTVFGEEDLRRAGQINAFMAVNQLPSLAGSNSTETFGTTQSTGTGGMSSLNLRGLGATRTLTLLDNQRVVGALNTGVTDAGAFPLALVKRVEVVTGGASASWGSDAVAGVVNYVLDHDFVGVKGSVNGGVTTYDDNEQGSFTLAVGTKLIDDRLGLIASGEYQDNAGVPRGIGDRDWYDGTGILKRSIADTPPGEPQYIVAPRMVDMRLAPGGIITQGPLAGIAFGPGGAPYEFQYGSLIAEPNMAGGEQSGDVANNSNLDSAQERWTFYGRISFDATPDVNLYATYNYGDVRTFGHSWPGQYRTGTLTVSCDNAFLPESIGAACIDNGISSFRLGTYVADLPDSVAVNRRSMNRFTAGLDADVDLFGDIWSLSAYASHGESYTVSRLENNVLNPLLFAAIDAVEGPNGTIVCRSAEARANGCIPFNIIGTGVVSSAAIDYVNGTPFMKTWLKQDVAASSLAGEPFENWAGPVSFVFGGEYRKESFHQQADAASTGDAGNPLLSPNGRNWFTGNFQPAAGSYDVWEGFAETVVPLFGNGGLGTGELNLAARATQYSEAGYVTTWKYGGTWETPIEGLRLRALQSRDIRAPNLSELFRAPLNITGTVTDRFPPYDGVDMAVNQATLANTDLDPERSNTWQVGTVYQPSWLSGLSVSADFYNISVKGAIGALTAQQVVDLCFQGNQAVCDFVIRNDDGQIAEIQRKPINRSSTKTQGLDIELSYRVPVADFIPNGSGMLTLRTLATHVFKFDTDSGLPNAVVAHDAGENGGNIADWRLYATQSYSNDRISFTLTERYISSGVINNNWIECDSACPAPTISRPTINDNHIDGALYVNAGATYNVTPELEIYFNVNNVFNVDPPKTPYSGSAPFLYRATNSSLYDTLGRYYRLGVRFYL